MKFNKDDIRKNIISALEATKEYSTDEYEEIAFHMLDWIDDLENLINFYQNPKEFKSKEINDLLITFLIHAPNHIAFAAKIMTGEGPNDIFKLKSES